MGASPLNPIEQLEKLRASPLIKSRAKGLPLGLASIDAVLPDGGLPRGVVVELSTPAGLGRATRFALAACASAQREAQNRAGEGTEGSWCAWVDPGSSLFAPAVACAGVDLDRLLVVRPVPSALARIAVRLAASQVFSVIVLDRCGVPGAEVDQPSTRWSTVVRRLAFAIEGSDCTVVLLSSTRQINAGTLPVAMRIELGRGSLEHLSLRIAKERHGRISGPHAIKLVEGLETITIPALGRRVP